MADDAIPGGMTALAKAGAVLAALETGEELSAADLAARVDEPVSSTYRLLSQLVSAAWVDKGHARGTFRVAASFLQLGAHLEDQLSIRRASERTLIELQQSTRLTAFLCVLRATGAVCIDRVDGKGVRSLTMRVGDSLPLDRGGAPLALLANAPAEERAELVSTLASTAGARTALDARLSQIRADGVAWSDGDVTPGIAAIGAPVFNHRGELEGAISVSGLREQLLAERATLEHLVAEAARTVSRSLGFNAPLVRATPAATSGVRA